MVEETFDIVIPNKEADRIRMVRGAITAVEKYVRMQRPWVKGAKEAMAMKHEWMAVDGSHGATVCPLSWRFG